MPDRHSDKKTEHRTRGLNHDTRWCHASMLNEIKYSEVTWQTGDLGMCEPNGIHDMPHQIPFRVRAPRLLHVYPAKFRSAHASEQSNKEIGRPYRSKTQGGGGWRNGGRVMTCRNGVLTLKTNSECLCSPTL